MLLMYIKLTFRKEEFLMVSQTKIATNTLFLSLLEHFLNLFPILKNLLIQLEL